MTELGRRELIVGGAKMIGAVTLAQAGISNAAQRTETKSEHISMATDSKTAIRASGSILELIGNSSLLELHNVVPDDHARIFLKLENENPTGSMKDRMALAMIEEAEKDGRLKPGGRVVEYTGGSTGVSLSFICRVKGYPLDLVTSDAFSLEKRNHMAALGANIVLVESDQGGMDEALTRNMIEVAKVIQEESGAYWTDQLNNLDVFGNYHQLGEEIWQQTGGGVDAFVQGVGTGGSLRGAAERLLEHNPDVHIVAVEPAESAVLSGEEEASHRIEGIGAGFVVPLWRPEIVDDISKVSTEEAQTMARRLAAEEGVFAGTSTGANLVAAMRLAKQWGPDKIIVALMVDTGMKYLSTELYKNEG